MSQVQLSLHLSWKNRSNTVTISGNFVNLNIDCLVSSYRLWEYNWYPTIIIWIISSTEVILLILLEIKTYKLIATHCCPAFYPNTTTFPWQYGAWIFFCSIYIKWRSWISVESLNWPKLTLVSTMKRIVACTEGQILT